MKNDIRFKESMRLIGLGLVCIVWLLTQLACNSRPAAPNAPAAAQSPATAQSPVAGQSPAAAQSPASQSGNYPNLLAQAQEVNDAFRRRDFARMVDMTYPKVVEAAGGRERMLAAFNKEMKEMEAEGVTVLSSTAGAPTQIIRVAKSIYAVIPTTLKVKARDGVFQTESSMIGISSDGGTNWTFIDAGGKDQKELKSLLPDAADKLNLPPEKQPVKISNN